VVVKDSSGKEHSKSLKQLPLEIAASVVQECLAHLREGLLEQQSLLASKVKAIERIETSLEGSRRPTQPETELVEPKQKEELEAKIQPEFPIESVPAKVATPEAPKEAPAAVAAPEVPKEVPASVAAPEVPKEAPPVAVAPEATVEVAPTAAAAPEAPKEVPAATQPQPLIQAVVDEGNFSFSATFEEQRQALDGRQEPPAIPEQKKKGDKR